MPASTSLAREGVVLDRHYGFWACAPSRASLLSGRFPLHVLGDNFAEDDVNGGVPEGMTLLPQKLKAAGYATHATGKWHLGHATHAQLPKMRGFDTFLGHLGGEVDHWTQAGDPDKGFDYDLWFQNKTLDRPAFENVGSAYGDEQFIRQAVDAIQRHDLQQPLFLYLAFQNPHVPLQVPNSFEAGFPRDWTQDRATYTGMVRYLDNGLLNITAALKERNMWQHTFLLFSSDHGGGTGSNSWPLSGRKGDPFDGGVRLAAFMSGGFLPERVRGTRQGGFIHLADWYRTLCNLAGAEPIDAAAAASALPPIDSLDMGPLLFGASTASPRKEIPLVIGLNTTRAHAEVIIVGRYKVVRAPSPLKVSQWTPNCPTQEQACPESIEMDCSLGCLFDILNDPGEQTQVLDEGVTTKMLQRMDELARTGLYTEEVIDPHAAAAWQRKYDGFLGPWLD